MELESQQTDELSAAVKEMDQKIETLEAAKKSIEDDKTIVMKEKVRFNGIKIAATQYYECQEALKHKTWLLHKLV